MRTLTPTHIRQVTLEHEPSTVAAAPLRTVVAACGVAGPQSSISARMFHQVRQGEVPPLSHVVLCDACVAALVGLESRAS